MRYAVVERITDRGPIYYVAPAELVMESNEHGVFTSTDLDKCDMKKSRLELKAAEDSVIKKVTCRMNSNHMGQFEQMDGFVVFNFKRKLDARRFKTYELTIRPVKIEKKKI
jgi:hypothetical protein